MRSPFVKLMRDAASLTLRLRQDPSDISGPSRVDTLRERSEAADLIDRLRTQIREHRREISEMQIEKQAAKEALPLLRFAEPLGTTVEEMETAVVSQRLLSSGDVVLAWVNQADLLRMQAAAQAEDHGDHRQILEVWDDDPIFGHLITYDPDHNDPPADLLPEAEAWLKAEQPDTVVTHGKLAMSYVLNFPSPEALKAFRAEWGRGGENVFQLRARAQ